MESLPQNAEFRNNPENFHPCIWVFTACKSTRLGVSHIQRVKGSFQAYAENTKISFAGQNERSGCSMSHLPTYSLKR